MVAETLTATRAASTFPVAAAGPAGMCHVAWGTYAVAANVEAGDIFEMCRLPPGATVVMGWIFGTDMDTDATETIDFDVGWAANGVEALDADGFGNFGVTLGDAVTGYLATTGFCYPLQNLMLSGGPKSFTNETVVQVTCNAAAATFTAGQLSVVVLYTTP